MTIKNKTIKRKHKRFTSMTSHVRIEIKFGSITIDKQLPVADVAVNTALRGKPSKTRTASGLATYGGEYVK